MTIEIGARLGAYEILAAVGAGGMGEVYKAKDTRLDRIVAIKVLSSGRSSSGELRQRFEREAKAVSALNHPHVCTLHDIGRDGDIDYLVMEYLEGETLAERLLRGALPIDAVIAIGRQIADALDRAHAARVVHRDLKPANIMLTKTGAKLLDFGLAAPLRERAGVMSFDGSAPTAERNLTQDGAVIGTYQYMAPEQVEGKDVTPRTDIFALGAVLFEMATGRKAFKGDNPATLMSAILSTDVPAVSSVRQNAPAALDAIVSSCLEKSVEDRWGSSGDVAKYLGFVADGRVEPTATRKLRIRGSLRTAAAILAGIALGGIGLWLASPTKPAGAMRVSIPGPAEAPIPGEIALTPDGKTLVFVGFKVGRSTWALYRRASSDWEASALVGTEGARSPSISPDGEWIAYATTEGFKKLPLAGGTPTTLSDLYANFGSDWGSGGRIAFGSGSDAGNEAIYVVPENGGEAVRLTDPAIVPARDPQWLPRDRNLLIVTEAGIEALDPDSRSRTFLLEGDSPRYVSSGHLVFARDSTLWAVGFDAQTLEVRGDPVPVVENVSRSSTEAFYAVGVDGALAFLPGGSASAKSLLWVDRKGNATPIEGLPTDNYLDLSLSPDQKRVAATVRGPDGENIWVLDLERGSRNQLTLDGTNQTPRWSIDGSHILYSSPRDGTWRVFRTKADGSGHAEALPITESARVVDVSPDGEQIAFNPPEFTSNMSIWSKKTGSVVVDETPFFDGGPRFDPTGDYLAYTSTETGQLEVYIRAIETGERWTVSKSGGKQAVWARDGRTLFYRFGGEMWSVDIERGSDFVPGEPVLLFDQPYGVTADNPIGTIPQFDVASDGRILMTRDVSSGPTEIRLMLDLHEELRRLTEPR